MSRIDPAEVRLGEILLHFWPYNRRYAVFYYPYLLSNVAGVLAGGVIMPLYIRQFIDVVAAEQSATAATMRTLMLLLLFIGLWSLVRVLTVVISDLCITHMGPKAIRDIENDSFEALHRLSPSFFAGAQVGSLVARVKRFSHGYNMLDLHMTHGLLESAVQLVATIIVVALFSMLLSLIFVAWGILYLLIVLIAVRWKMRLDVRKVRTDSASTGLLADGISNVLTVKTFASSREELAYFKQSTQEVADATKRSWRASTVINGAQALLVAIMSFLMLFVALGLWRDGIISVGTIVLVQTYVFIMGAHFLQMGEQLKAIYRAGADCMEMMEIFRMKPAVLDPPRPRNPAITRGAVAFNSVTFGYHTDRPVFRDFSLRIPSGQKVGLVGYSGAGKSTLFALLLRFMDVQGGAITIDGQDIRAITQDNLRSRISYVPQEPLLFHRTIRDNIVYGKTDATDEDMHRAARRAHAEEFIARMPKGYDTVVGERGVKLSGGERQRIAIARAMLKDAPILLLDEATSSLDSVSERHIRDAFDSLTAQRTTLVIAHRLSTVQKLDRIIVLDKGALMEDGTHEELLKLQGVYADLWQHQSNGLLGV